LINKKSTDFRIIKPRLVNSVTAQVDDSSVNLD